jgi:hypothetical protein
VAIDEALEFTEGGNETGRFFERASFTENAIRLLDTLAYLLRKAAASI